MPRDYTLHIYKELLKTLLNEGFFFLRVYEYYTNQKIRKNANLEMRNDAKRYAVFRQDVDRLSVNSLTVARIQKEMGIRSTFYFRSVPQSFNPEIIEEIVGMGHEIGYHYEDLSLAAKQRTDLDWQSADRNKHGTRNTEQLFEAAIDLLVGTWKSYVIMLM